MEHINNWKNKNVFIKQLELNKKELNGNYPNHWNSFINIINSIDLKSCMKILDIGCGCGSYYELCRRHFKNLEYSGIDYSVEAIEIAKENWKYDNFFVKSFDEIDKTFIENYDIIHMGALLDILPNAEEALDFILKLGVKYVILSRVEISEQRECKTYMAYDEIITYKYRHAHDEIMKTIYINNYNVSNIDGDNILLKIKN